MKEEETYDSNNEKPFKKINSLDLDEISLDSQKRPPATSVSTGHQSENGITVKGLICVITLFVINLLNYMDRYTVAGVLSDVQDYYNINDSKAGVLQTVFIVFYLIFAPINGYLGDRYNRKIIMVVGLIVWILAVLSSSVVGIGEASYATIAPTIIADLFTGVTRSRVLMVFYFAIPVGSGLGYVVGSEVSKLAGAWQWGIRVTPIAGIFCILALIFIIEEPVRGAAEAEAGAKDATVEVKSSYLDDIKYLISVKSFLLSNVGYTLVVFATGTLAWWTPTAILYGKAGEQGVTDIDDPDFKKKNNSSLIFGALTCLGGIVGVTTGIFTAQFLKQGKACFRSFKTDRGDPIVCGLGSLLAIPFMVFGLRLVNDSPTIGYIAVFFAVTFLSLNWAIVVDILLYIIVPRKRNLASAWQISMSHLFGDASGPYIIGLVSDRIRGSDDSPQAHFNSLIDSFYIPCVLLLISGIAFFISAKTIIHDKNIFEQAMGYRKKSAKVGDIANGNVIESSRL